MESWKVTIGRLGQRSLWDVTDRHMAYEYSEGLTSRVNVHFQRDLLRVEDSGFLAWEVVSPPVQGVHEGCGLSLPAFE